MRRPAIAREKVVGSGVLRFAARMIRPALTLAPATIFARSRATVSTSGSSGTPAPTLHLVPPEPCLRLHGEWDVECECPLHRLDQQRDELCNFALWRFEEEFVVHLEDEA